MQDILSQLGYLDSPNFLRDDGLDLDQSHAHTFRQAKELCGLHGVYILRSNAHTSATTTPVLYVCEAQNDQDALRIHRHVWNQNIVPFLLVKSPRYLRLYKGFTYSGVRGDSANPAADTLAELELERISETLSELSILNNDIDGGNIWTKWGNKIRPDDRVDISLLKELQKLGSALREDGLDSQTAHALIGKYVYLRYLRDRDILSDRKLLSWEIAPEAIFKRHATLKAFDAVNQRLDEWLNGSVFPIPAGGTPYRRSHIQRVASVFFGDTMDGQLHLNFDAYDFSAIPTETLSTIYEQFLHAPTTDAKPSKGKRSAAHYTPLPLVNLTIGELEQWKPLKKGMKVLDPSCGSGAFLVQCYRRLIEKERQSKRALTPLKLKQLLTDHIFGVELHEDACKVTALNLVLTLLDNVTPPDLENKQYGSFKLPDLLATNIFCANLFDPDSVWAKKSVGYKFDWVVGNPPWKEVKKHSKEPEDIHALNWMQRPENRTYASTDNQLAETFVWRIGRYLSERGHAGLVLPAMTFTKHDSRFRKVFFAEYQVQSVINLSNLRKKLFRAPGKSSSASSPASVVCYKQGRPNVDDFVHTYAPFGIDQVANRHLNKITAWSLTINSSDIQELPLNDLLEGSHLPWKIAMWGSPRDLRILRKLDRTFSTFGEFCDQHRLVAHEGFQFVASGSAEPREYLPSLATKKKLVIKSLRGCGRIFSFPDKAIEMISESECYVRIGRAELPNLVSTPPHIILDAARRFAVYSDEFIAVPPRQIGIAGPEEQRELLLAVAAYLSSDFVKYWEFLAASEWGIKSDRSTLRTLRSLPVPAAFVDGSTIQEWAALYVELAQTEELAQAKLLKSLNDSVSDALQLRRSERILVEDMVRHKLKLLDGKIPDELSKKPSDTVLEEYLSEFQTVLDDFVGETYANELKLIVGKESAMLQVRTVRARHSLKPQILSADSEMSDAFTDLAVATRQKHSQWLYFERCLKVYDGTSMSLLKPLQTSQWLRSRALRDADDVIAELLAVEG